MNARRARRAALTATAGLAGAALVLGVTSSIAHAADPPPPLQVVVDDDTSLASVGGTVTYRLAVTAPGPSDEPAVDATLVLSEHLQLVSASDGGAAGPDPGHGWSAVTWDDLTVPAGTTRTVTATVRVLTSARVKVTAIGSAVGAAGPTSPRPSCADDPQCDLDVTAVDPPPSASVAPAAATTTKAAPAKKADKPRKAKKDKKKSKKDKAKKSKDKKDKKNKKGRRGRGR